MRFRSSALFLFMALSSAVLHAQEFSGHVTDSSGADVPKASITVHSQNTGVDFKTVSTGNGDYTVPYLKPDVYTILVAAQGFETTIKTDITLEVDQVAVINFVLKVGKVTESVTVKADDALLDFGKADHGEVVENTRVTELPLNGGDPNMLALLNSGAVWTGNIEYQRPFDDTMQNLSINGGGAGNNELMLDGVSNEAAPSNGGSNSVIAYVPPVDAVQEFKIITNAYDAQYGRAAGGALNEVLKSGTNRLHGDVYEFARRTFLDANTYQNNFLLSQGGSPTEYSRPRQSWDQYGAEMDGPIRVPKLYNGKDKSFFLLQYENFKEVVPNSTVTSVPSPQWINGDFSNLTYWNGSAGEYQPIWIYDPRSLTCDANGNCTRQTFAAEAGHPGEAAYNVIPSDRLNATAKAIMSYYPAPNTPTTAGTNPFANNFATPTPEVERYRNVLGKWDQNISSSDRFTLRYGYWERIETGSTNGMPGVIAQGNFPHGERAHTFATEETHTFTPNLLFNFKATASVRTDYTLNSPGGFDETSLGWSSSMVGQFGYAGGVFPSIEPSEFANIGGSAPNQTVENTLSILPSVTWIKGKHNIHAGLDARFLQYIVTANGGGPFFWADREWTQSNYIDADWNAYSGNTFASLLLGTATSGSFSNNAQAFWSQHYWAPYVQDDWKITRRLTLNLGVRWDVNMPQTERDNRAQYVFDTTAVNPVNSSVPATPLLPHGVIGGPTFLGVNGNPRTLYATSWKNIQPRVGFAYALNNRMVLRGGFGEMFSNPTPGGNLAGFSATTYYDPSDDGGKTPNDNLSDPYSSVLQPVGASLGMETNLGQSQYFLNPHFKIPSFWSYSLGFQQQLSRTDTLEMSYVGSKSFNGATSDNINHETAAYQQQCNLDMGGNPDICNNDYPANPFYGVAAFSGSGNYYSGANGVQGGNFTRPFPAFGDVTEWQLNDGHTWYNSLQVTAMHKWNKTLTLHGTWTWSKLMDSGGWTDETYRVPYRGLDGNDRTHRVTISGVYLLPVGKGQRFLATPSGVIGHVLDTIVGGWEFAASYIYETGWPWVVPNNPNEHYLHSALVPRHVESTGYIRGVAPCIGQWQQNAAGAWSVQTLTNFNYSGTCAQNDFQVIPDYGEYTNNVYTGIRVPNDQQFDTNLSKNFGLVRGLKLQIRLEAFNTFNHPLFQESYEGSAQDTNFGTIEKGPWGASNLPREVQIAAKIIW
jgi:hypothetical protein